jgi:hypothetical protein
VCQKKNRNASPGGGLLCVHAPPHRRRFGVRIPGGQKQLSLMRSQCLRGFVACWPPSETALRQTLRGDPEPLAVVGEDSDCLAAAAAKDKQATGKRIGIEFLTTELRQRIDAFPSVDGFNRNQDAELRRDLDQGADSSNSRISVAR